MNKILLTTLSLATAISLNAAVLATAGDIKVTDEDIAPLLQPQGGMHGMMGDVKVSEADKKNMVDNVIKYKLLVKQAKDSGIQKDPEYKKSMDMMADSLAFQVWQKKEFDKVKVSDADAKKFYDENADKLFMKPDEVKAKHILVDDEKKAKEIIAKLAKVEKSKLKDEFSKVAGAESKDPTAKQNGGDLGWFSKNQMVKEFGDAAFALKDGEMSKTPVKSDFGYHIILKEESKKAQKVPFDSVKDMIKESLKGQKFQQEITTKSDELFKKANVKYTK
ncbi:peptidylprolyl isomerase [Campylobacter geochelonis]|uniref:peptidylprolyl isomerase n=1 Tax=Campylobacter geochelonis TaxID=1780362 RepID=A0A128EHS4_9BACT|nr:peptidylprolyl isomerase [Campylobacter geochelonis]QKF71383.1 SurA-like chaperone / peptidyl-prolyl cis-trans isomerase [Campylobacter geochelonis]CZE48147.1 foldase protein PrsA [Campylobacter geochelonis]CZE51472.1 foldase protein PrsA [Campylobacter geochelonis]